jgi:hypothetical protein
VLIDLLIVVVLGAALAWQRPDAKWRDEIAVRARSLAHFLRALLRTPLGHLLVLLAIVAALQWSIQLAVSGWRSLDPAEAMGELDEEARCHAWQERIKREGPVNFAPSEFACPVGAGPFKREALGSELQTFSCTVHGEAK